MARTPEPRLPHQAPYIRPDMATQQLYLALDIVAFLDILARITYPTNPHPNPPTNPHHRDSEE